MKISAFQRQSRGLWGYFRHGDWTWVMISSSKETKDNVLWHKTSWQTHKCELRLLRILYTRQRIGLAYKTFLKRHIISCFNLEFYGVNFPLPVIFVHQWFLFFALFSFNYHSEISTVLLKTTIRGHVT